LAIEVTMISRDVSNQSCEGCFLSLNSFIRVLSDLNLVSISMFMFLGSWLGFGLFSCDDVGFGFPLTACSMLIKYVIF